MKPEEIETRLRDEMADLAPDRLEDLLAACDAQPQESVPQESAPQPAPACRRPVWKPLAAAAVFVLLIGGIFGYRALDRSVCTVIVDINPSVTLTVNRLGRVKAMDTGNADAAALLADIDLAGARTQDALDTLTDALTDADYLTDADNTLLVTVEGASAARAQKLGKAVYDAAQASAQQRQFSAAVLCQQAADSDQTRTDADAWQVSPGKAALAETIALQTQLDTAQTLSALPVQDLLVLAETYEVTFDTAQLYGTVSHDGYRSEDDVRAIAGGDAAVDPSACTQELTQYGGQLAYRVRFAAAGGEYCYTIAARTGEILDVQRPEQPAQTPDTPATPGKPDDSAAPAGSEISISEALSRVLQELGISLPDIRDVNAQRVQVSGRDAYHITFTANGKPYSFYVDTHDGDLF